jgi:hypothetical protein
LFDRHRSTDAGAIPERSITGRSWHWKVSQEFYRGLAKGAIDAVNAGQQKELSAAYRYRADTRPGTFNGQRYDGVMRDVAGNHVALVREGRADSDVVVGDAAIPSRFFERFPDARRIGAV